MPRFTVTHPTTGKSVTITGPSMPSEQELDSIFAQTGGSSRKVYGKPDASPAETERMRREFVAKEGTTATQARDTLNQAFNPTVKIPAADSLGDWAGRVVPQSLTQLVPKVAMGAYDAVKGQTDPLIASLADLDPNKPQMRQQMEGNALRSLSGLAQAMAAPTGLMGVDAAKEAWLTDPAGSALALAPTVKVVAGGMKAVPRATAKVQNAAANKLYDMTLKQGTTLKPELRQQNVKTGLEGGYLPNSKGVDKLAADVAATEQKLGAGIAAGEAAKVRGTLDRAISNVEGLREQANRSANPARANAMIDAEIERLRANPMQSDAAQPVPYKEFAKGKMGTYMKEEGGHGPAMQRISREYKEYKSSLPTGGDIPIGEIQKMKVEQGRHIKYQVKNGQSVDPFKATIDKARIRGLKEEVEVQLADTFPELKDTNQQLGKMYKLQDVLERAANRIENNQGIGIGLPIKSGAGATVGGMLGGPAGAAAGAGIGTLIGIIEHPSVAPRLAVMLHRSSKGKLSMPQSKALVASRLEGLKKKLKSEHGAVGAIGAVTKEEEE